MIENVSGIRLHYGAGLGGSHSKRGLWKRQMIERLEKKAEEERVARENEKLKESLYDHYDRSSDLSTAEVNGEEEDVERDDGEET